MWEGQIRAVACLSAQSSDFVEEIEGDCREMEKGGDERCMAKKRRRLMGQFLAKKREISRRTRSKKLVVFGGGIVGGRSVVVFVATGRACCLVLREWCRSSVGGHLGRLKLAEVCTFIGRKVGRCLDM